MPNIHHPSGLNERVVAKVVARRGRLHAFETIEPARTALVAVDMTRAAIELDDTSRSVVPAVNAVADGLRKAGGTVCWVTAAPDPSDQPRMATIVGADRARMFHDMACADDPGSRLWHELDNCDGDVQVSKRGASAFFPGKCDLPDVLRAQSIDTVLIAGTVTNVCCESSARDAVELGYRVIMVSDALAGHSFGLHEASLTTFYRIFGDVRPSSEVLDLIETGSGYDETTPDVAVT